MDVSHDNVCVNRAIHYFLDNSTGFDTIVVMFFEFQKCVMSVFAPARGHKREDKKSRLSSFGNIGW